ncbi:hypothetical protein Tco_0744574 [Tanacetum coccineum]
MHCITNADRLPRLFILGRNASFVRGTLERVGILLGYLGGAPLCAAGRPSCLLVSKQKHPGYLGNLAALIPSLQHLTGFMGVCLYGRSSLQIPSGMTLLLRKSRSPSSGNFYIPFCASEDVECSSSPIFTSRDIWPNGQMVSPLNPMSGVVAGIIWLLISGRSLMKQCSYRTSEDAPPSSYVPGARSDLHFSFR